MVFVHFAIRSYSSSFGCAGAMGVGSAGGGGSANTSWLLGGGFWGRCYLGRWRWLDR